MVSLIWFGIWELRRQFGLGLGESRGLGNVGVKDEGGRAQAHYEVSTQH